MKALSVRLEDDVYSELDSLSHILGTSKNSIINMLIRSEYNKYYEDPKIKKFLEQANELKALLAKFSSENK